MDNIDIYNNSEFILSKNIPNKIISWITILALLLIIILIVLNIQYNEYKIYLGYVKFINNNYYIEIELDQSDFPINIDNKLYINDKEYKYYIVNIEKNIVTLKIDLDDKYLVKNNKIFVNILSKRTSFFDKFKQKIKKGLNL